MSMKIVEKNDEIQHNTFCSIPDGTVFRWWGEGRTTHNRIKIKGRCMGKHGMFFPHSGLFVGVSENSHNTRVLVYDAELIVSPK